MGRRSDPPEVQAAKGFPGRRKSKTEKAIAEAERMAKILADAPADPLGAPMLLADERLAPALQVWKDYAPQLQKNNLLERTDRHIFAMFCVYTADWVSANEEILNKGHMQKVKTVSGSYQWKDTPAIRRRDNAMGFILELSKRFGLTPVDRFQLMKDQSHQAGLGGLFSTTRGEGEDKPAETPAGEEDVVGLLDKLDSAPPGSPVN